MTTPETKPDDAPYALLTSLNADGGMASITDQNSFLQVSLAQAKPGSLTERIIQESRIYPMEDMQEAVIDFFDRMRSTGLTGVLDSPEIRVFQKNPLDFCNAMTEEIWDRIDEEIDEDGRDDDFDNHPLSPLREAMVDASPEFGGGDALEPGV